LIDAVNNLNILDKDSIVVIWGSWYGSILIPSLADKVKKIVAIDLDDNALQIAKTRLFRDYNNINYVCDDIFKTYRDVYLNTNLIINTSCEHMAPMKEWTWFQKFNGDTVGNRDNPVEGKYLNLLNYQIIVILHFSQIICSVLKGM
jgi:hypothetical protein